MLKVNFMIFIPILVTTKYTFVLSKFFGNKVLADLGINKSNKSKYFFSDHILGTRLFSNFSDRKSNYS